MCCGFGSTKHQISINLNRKKTLNEIIEWAKNIQNKDKVKDYKLDLRGLIITEIES